jgi:hypothetical protein
MSLKLCYECSNQVSRKAIVCPKCGVPLQKGSLGKKVLFIQFYFGISFILSGQRDGLIRLEAYGFQRPILFAV